MNNSKTIWGYGIGAGLILNTTWWVFNALFMDMDNYDMSKGEVFGYASMILSVVIIFYGVKNYRDNLPSAVISFKNAFLTGLYMALIASAIYVVGWMLYSEIMMPNFEEEYAARQVSILMESGATAIEVQDAEREMESFVQMFKNPFIKAGFTFLEFFPIGLLAALVSALVLKRKRT